MILKTAVKITAPRGLRLARVVTVRLWLVLATGVVDGFEKLEKWQLSKPGCTTIMLPAIRVAEPLRKRFAEHVVPKRVLGGDTRFVKPHMMFVYRTGQ